MLLKGYNLNSMEQSPTCEADSHSQLVKKFHAFYGTRRLNSVFTTARFKKFIVQTLMYDRKGGIINTYSFHLKHFSFR